METLQQKIKSSIREAMLSKESVRLEVLRGISASMTNELVAKGRTPQDTLTDEEVLAVITRLSKQRKDSIDQYAKGGREDLVKEEETQLAILETYLPKMMEEGEARKIVEAKKSELNISDATQKGRLMSEAMKDLKGKADGAIVKKVVDSLF